MRLVGILIRTYVIVSEGQIGIIGVTIHTTVQSCTGERRRPPIEYMCPTRLPNELQVEEVKLRPHNVGPSAQAFSPFVIGANAGI